MFGIRSIEISSSLCFLSKFSTQNAGIYFSAILTRKFLRKLARCQFKKRNHHYHYHHHKENYYSYTKYIHSPWHPRIIVSPMRTLVFFSSFVNIGGGAVLVTLKENNYNKYRKTNARPLNIVSLPVSGF